MNEIVRDTLERELRRVVRTIDKLTNIHDGLMEEVRQIEADRWDLFRQQAQLERALSDD